MKKIVFVLLFIFTFIFSTFLFPHKNKKSEASSTSNINIVTNNEVMLNWTPQPNDSKEMIETIESFIDSATHTIHITIYGFNNDRVYEALERFVMSDTSHYLYIVFECDYWEHISYGDYYRRLSSLPRTTYVSDSTPYACSGRSLMHSKYIVRDYGILSNKAILFSTANWTDTGIGANRNTIGVIDRLSVRSDADLDTAVAGFMNDYQEMIGYGRFSRSKISNGIENVYLADGSLMRLYFLPQDRIEYEADLLSIFNERTNFETNLDVFYFTYNSFGDAYRNNILISGDSYGILDATGFDGTGSELPSFCSRSSFHGKVETSLGKNHNKNLWSTVGDFYFEGRWWSGVNIIQSANMSNNGTNYNSEFSVMILGNIEVQNEIRNVFWNAYNVYPDWSLCNPISAEMGIPQCEDELDNDYDGYVDRMDWDCSRNETTIELCTDDIDNDSDGKTDLDDEGCWHLTVSTFGEYPLEEIWWSYYPFETPSSNGVDNYPFEFPRNDDEKYTPSVFVQWSAKYSEFYILDGKRSEEGECHNIGLKKICSSKYRSPIIQEVSLYVKTAEGWIEYDSTYSQHIKLEYYDYFGEDVEVYIAPKGIEGKYLTINVCEFYNECD